MIIIYYGNRELNQSFPHTARHVAGCHGRLRAVGLVVAATQRGE